MIKTVLCGDLNMPIIGLGTWQATDEQELETALNTSLEIGYRHIDTATVYQNEHIIGKVLDEWISSGKITREELFIVTKLPLSGVHPDRLEKNLIDSLQLLRLDYVDLYLIHFPVGMTLTDEFEDPNHEGVWQKMEQQVDAGRAKTIGLSNFNIGQIENIMSFARIKPACNQIELHVFMQQPELVSFCQENGIVVTAYSPLGSPAYNKFLLGIGKEEKKDLINVFTNTVLKDIAQKHNKSNAQIALKFLIQKDIVVIPKSINPERLKSNINLFDFCLDDDDLQQIEQLDVGEEARIFDFKFLPGIEDQPEYPFPKIEGK